MFNWASKILELKNAVTETLEQITFSIVEEQLELKEYPRYETAESYITVTSEAEKRTRIEVSLPVPFLENIVSVLYPNEDDPSQYQQDTLDELTNTICGIFVRALEPETGSFKLSIPYRERPADWKPGYVFHFVIDDIYPLCISIGAGSK